MPGTTVSKAGSILLATSPEQVFSGCLQDLPPQQSNIIRIFLSSTFTDYTEERNKLMIDAFPKLRVYCQERGLDFQVADMRWGVRDDAQTDHQTTQICLQEVTNCQQVSKGPYFVALLGNKYGWRPFPPEINSEEFRVLMKAAHTSAKDPTLLTDWFQKDENALPSTYILKPITSVFPFYNDESSENEDKRKKAHEQWQAVYGLLAATLRSAASCAHSYGRISESQKQKYFRSVTENEIDEGMMSSSHSEFRTLCFCRQLNGISQSDTVAGRYMDLEGGQIDIDSQDLLSDLKNVKLPRCVGDTQISSRDIKWSSCGVDPEDPNHKEYLTEFSTMFQEKIKDQIDLSLKSQQSLDLTKRLFDEVLHHSHFCVQKTKHFCGREEVMNEIFTKMQKVYSKMKADENEEGNADKMLQMIDVGVTPRGTFTEDDDVTEGGMKKDEKSQIEKELNRHSNYVEARGVKFGLEEEELTFDDCKAKELDVQTLTVHTKPVVIYGPSGSGKTSLMAKIASTVDTVTGKETVKITRFLGTSSQSSSIRATILSICDQIRTAYNIQKPAMIDLESDFSYLVLYFRALLTKVNSKEKPLIIILDSVDQLSDEDYAHGMLWLPSILPTNVHLIISMIPEVHNCLENTQIIVTEEECFVEVPPLPRETASDILDLWLGGIGRKLTGEQRSYVLGILQRCPQPMYLKMSFEQAKIWKSFTPQEEMALGQSTKSAIEHLFVRLEKDHGKILVSRSLGYLTAAKHGLTNNEIEDILSCDDEVLEDTYLYHLPPSDALVRLPPLLWQRIRYDLREYLVERQSGGKNVVTWHHRQFTEAATARYLTSKTLPLLHNGLADYFMGKWCDQPKSLKLYKRKKADYPDCSRGVPPQPLVICNNVYNLRKMEELPHHLILAGREEDFMNEICHNLDWLYYKSKAISTAEMMKDIAMALSSSKIKLNSADNTKPKNEKHPSRTLDFTIQQNEEMNGYEEEIDDNDVKDAYITELVQDDLNEADNAKKESDREAGKETLQRIVHDMKHVFEVLTLASDAVRRDVKNLPLQILGQMTPETATTEGLSHLWTQASQWADCSQQALLVPQGLCLPTPGRGQISSMEIAISYPGDPYEHEKKLHLSADTNLLFAVERTRQKNDVLKVFDLANSGATMKTEQLNQEIKYLEMSPCERFMILQVYTHRDKYNPRYYYTAHDMVQQRVLTFPKMSMPISFSAQGQYCVLIRDKLTDYVAKQEQQSNEPEKEDVKVAGMHDVAELYEIESGKCIPLRVPEKTDTAPKVCHALFSTDGQYVVVFTKDSISFVFMIPRGKLCGQFRSDDKKVSMSFNDERHHAAMKKNTALLNNNYLLRPGNDYSDNKNLFVYDLNTSNLVAELNPGKDYSIAIVSVSNSQTKVATANSDSLWSSMSEHKYVFVWDMKNLRQMSVCKDKGPYSAVQFAGEDEEFLLVCKYHDSSATVWYIGTHKEECQEAVPLSKIIGHSNAIVYMQVRQEKKVLVTGSLDNTVKVWDLEYILGNCRQKIEDAEDMTSLAGEMNKQLDRPYKAGEERIQTTATTVSKNGRVAVVGTWDGWVIFYDLESRAVMRYQKTGSKPVVRLLTSQSGRYIVSASEAILVWDSQTGEVVQKLVGGLGQQANCLAEGNDILVVGYGGMECYGYVWNLATGDQMTVLKGLYGFQEVAITSDGKRVVSTMFDYPMLFDVSTGELVEGDDFQPDTMMAGCTCLRISPDDQLVAACSTDGTVRVSDMKQAGYKYCLKHRSSVPEATFSKNSQQLLTAGFKNILVWSMKDGSLLHTLSRHTDFITRMKFTLNDDYLISCGMDKQLVVWDFNSFFSVASFQAHCPLRDFSVAESLHTLLFAPENVDYLGVLKPNERLQKIVKGEAENSVPQVLQQAQACAFTFTPQKIQQKTSRACIIL